MVILVGRTISNSATMCNALVDVAKHYQYMNINLNIPSKMYQLDGDNYDEVVKFLPRFSAPIVNRSGYYVFKASTPLSRDEFESVISNWSNDPGPCYETSPKDTFWITLPVCNTYKMRQSLRYIWNDSKSITENLLEDIIDTRTCINGCVY